jgi:hypothetical protein
MIDRSIHFPDKTDQNFAEKHFDQAKISVFPASSPAWDVDGKIKGVPAPDPYVVGSVDEFRMAPKGGCHTALDISPCFQRKTVWHRRSYRFSSWVCDRPDVAQVPDPSS